MRDLSASLCTNGARNIGVVHGPGMLVPKIKLNRLIPVAWGVRIIKKIYDGYFNSVALGRYEQLSITDGIQRMHCENCTFAALSEHVLSGKSKKLCHI